MVESTLLLVKFYGRHIGVPKKGTNMAVDLPQVDFFKRRSCESERREKRTLRKSNMAAAY